jgi:hypothetical protein
MNHSVIHCRRECIVHSASALIGRKRPSSQAPDNKDPQKLFLKPVFGDADIAKFLQEENSPILAAWGPWSMLNT